MINDQIHINEFGFSELYEWKEIPNFCKYGRLVQFNEEIPYLIQLAKNNKDIIGVTTVNSVVTSDLCDKNWINKYLVDEYGDLYVQEKTIAVGNEEYDETNNFSYISTKKEIEFEPILSEKFDKNKKYVSRINRPEWIRVNLLGKCIIEDFGTCKDAKYCKLYSGEDEKLFGTAVPADENENCTKWKILYRISEKTIMIFYK